MYEENVINAVEDGQHVKQVDTTTKNKWTNGYADTADTENGGNVFLQLMVRGIYGSLTGCLDGGSSGHNNTDRSYQQCHQARAKVRAKHARLTFDRSSLDLISLLFAVINSFTTNTYKP